MLIPPSVIFIVYGMSTQQSIGKLFIAGIIPGILLMLFYMLAIYLVVRKNPRLGPAGEKSTWRQRISSLRGGLLEVLIVFCISLGGLFAGWFTPTESGAVGAASLLVIAVLRKKLTLKGFFSSLSDTTRTTAMIMFLVAGATVFGRFISISRLPFEMASWAAGLALPPPVILAIVLAIYMILGCFIDALALVLLTVPIFYPVIVEVLGYDPIWFGVIIVMVVAMGVITPPVGMNVFIVKGVAKDVPLERIFKGIWPFFTALIACITVLVIFPQLSTFLRTFNEVVKK